jgi:uncharacterized protein (TIGR00369 family)
VDDAVPPPPDGFIPQGGRGGFSTHNGPLFHKPGGEGAVHAFYALPRHANGLGLVHGGMLTAFSDGLLAAAVFRGVRRISVTIHLSVDFLHMARVGEWVIGEAAITRATREVAFAEGRIHAGGVEVARANGIFKLMRARR